MELFSPPVDNLSWTSFHMEAYALYVIVEVGIIFPFGVKFMAMGLCDMIPDSLFWWGDIYTDINYFSPNKYKGVSAIFCQKFGLIQLKILK